MNYSPSLKCILYIICTKRSGRWRRVRLYHVLSYHKRVVTTE